MLEQYAGTLFYGLLVAAFVIVVLLESVRPLRQPGTGLGGRWGTNIGLFLLDSILLRTLQPIAAVAVAYYVEQRNWNLLSLSQAPLWLGIPLSVLIIDLGRYFEHVAFHQFKPLWRIHKVHHTDLDFDCTTGLRFHPLEALLGLGLDTLLIIVFGISPLAIVIVALLYVAETLFNHANLQLPPRPERVLRWLIVTPDMHRVHHSALRQETDRPFHWLRCRQCTGPSNERKSGRSGTFALALAIGVRRNLVQRSRPAMLLSGARIRRSWCWCRRVL